MRSKTSRTTEKTLHARICHLLEAQGPEGMGMADLFSRMPKGTPKGVFYRLTSRMMEAGTVQRVRWGVLRAASDAPLPSRVVKPRTRLRVKDSQTAEIADRILELLKTAGPDGVHRTSIRAHIGPRASATLIARAVRSLIEDGQAREPQWKWLCHQPGPLPFTARIMPFTAEAVQEHAQAQGVVPNTNPGNLPDIPVAWWLLEDAQGTKRAALVGAEDGLISVWTEVFGWVEVDDVVNAIPLPRKLG